MKMRISNRKYWIYVLWNKFIEFINVVFKNLMVENLESHHQMVVACIHLKLAIYAVFCAWAIALDVIEKGYYGCRLKIMAQKKRAIIFINWLFSFTSVFCFINYGVIAYLCQPGVILWLIKGTLYNIFGVTVYCFFINASKWWKWRLIYIWGCLTIIIYFIRIPGFQNFPLFYLVWFSWFIPLTIWSFKRRVEIRRKYGGLDSAPFYLMWPSLLIAFYFFFDFYNALFVLIIANKICLGGRWFFCLRKSQIIPHLYNASYDCIIYVFDYSTEIFVIFDKCIF
jgi:hypothetical protein